MSDTQWYYADSQRQRHGPLPTAQLRELLAQGRMGADALVWREGMADWQPVHSVAELAAAAPHVQPHDPYAAPASALPAATAGATLSDSLQAYAAFVGPRFPVYRRKWHLDRKPHPDSASTWNWAAFLFGAFWMLYRRMYGVAALWIVAMVVISIIEGLVQVSAAISLGINIGISCASGAIGNHLYLRHANRIIATVSTRHAGQGPAFLAELAASGGTRWLAVVIGIAVFVLVSGAAAFLPIG